ncbi:unnamed protein product [Prorocentrum cordatum]|uniref:Uncharacterized protein n=1 Tax=Prorocentrum cordatum TaxID=2364126 RepID=A0ABN9U862_9DINO|nr:unnamed protein product [Polarella glacialis]
MFDSCTADNRPESRRAAGKPSGRATDDIDQVERRAARNLEASNAAISAHIGALSERLLRLERHQFVPNGRRLPAAGDERRELEDEHVEALGAKVDPDGLQQGYAEFIATTKKHLNCVGVHTWSLCAATRANSGPATRCLALVPSVLLLFMQCFVLQIMTFASLHPSCSLDADCREGMWCAPSKDYNGFRRSPGMCDDCRWASSLESQDYDSLPSRYNAAAYAAAEETLSEAVAYCETADTEPDRCDYLVNFQSELTLAPLVVFICTTGLVLISLIADMDRQAQIAELLEHRITHVVAGPRPFVITSVAWLIFVLRMLVLPGVVVYAYAGLVLASPQASGVSLPVTFVVQGLVVCFVHNVDGVLALAFLDEQAQALIRKAFADMKAHEYKGDVVNLMESMDNKQLQYFFRRFLALCYGVLIVLIVMSTESIMNSAPVFRLDWDELPSRFVESPSASACTNVVTTLSATTILSTSFFALVWGLTYQITNSFRRCGVLDVVFAPVVTLVTMPALSFCLLKFGYTSI